MAIPTVINDDRHSIKTTTGLMEIFRQITANNIALKDYPFLKELAMEAYLMENEDILKLDTENFAEVTVLDAEIALTRIM